MSGHAPPPRRRPTPRVLAALALTALAPALAACWAEDPTFCNATHPCRQGQRCDLPNRTCLPVATDGGLGEGAGRGDARGTQALGTSCGGAGVCASGFCVDGRCCESACDGLCERCDISGALGACSAVPAGQDPGTECAPGTTASDALCAGTCDGARRCRFDTTKLCDGACRTVAGSGDTTAVSFRCGDDGRCNLSTAATTKLCQFSRCTGSGPSADCPVSCTTAADCLATSLCDRAEAHASGKGACVNPAQILRLTDATADANLNTALGQLSEAKPYLGLRPGTYTLGATLSGKRAVLIGLGAKPEDVTLRPSAAPALSVGPSATLQLQNLALVRPAGSPVVGDALTCSADATHRSSVTVLESILAGHADQGLEASYCDVAVRRSTLHANDGGGLVLGFGRFIVTDTLLYGNGTAGPGGSPAGGAKLDSTTPAVFLNNTVVSNVAASSLAAGVLCNSAATQLVNSIVAENSGDEVALCTVTASSVVAESTGAACTLTDFKPTTGVCLNDKGDNAAVAQSRLDHDNAPRIKGSKVDLGAFEVQ